MGCMLVKLTDVQAAILMFTFIFLFVCKTFVRYFLVSVCGS